MEMNLPPLAVACFLTGEPFADGQRVASHLVRDAKSPDVVRYDVLESAVAGFNPPGFVACRWVQPFKPRREGENPERAMKLTAENLFVTLADPITEPTAENTRLLQFLALLLERKRLLRPKGRTPDGEKSIYEHAKTKQLFEVPVGDLSPQFFLQVQEQLSVLVGPPKAKAAAPAPEAQLASSP
jgi:hypothetical protein